MKYIKTYENQILPKIGDYVLTNIHEKVEIICDFMNNNVGKIIDITNDKYRTYYVIQYNNIPKDLFKFFNHTTNFNDEKQYENYRFVILNEILYFSNNISDFNIFKDTKKYNL